MFFYYFVELDMLSFFLYMVFYIFRWRFHISHMCFIPPTPGFRFSFHPHSFPLPPHHFHFPQLLICELWRAVMCVCVCNQQQPPSSYTFTVEDLGAWFQRLWRLFVSRLGSYALLFGWGITRNVQPNGKRKIRFIFPALFGMIRGI